MKNLLKQLSPYKWLILIILLFHVGRAYTTLLLPDYTSRLIDVGIQNSGFQYGVPLEISQETGQSLQSLLSSQETKVFAENYSLTNQATYVLDQAIINDSKAMADLEETLLEPLSALLLMSQLKTGNPSTIDLPGLGPSQLQALETMPGSQIRTLVSEMTDKISPNLLKAGVIQLVKDEYVKSGNNLADFQWAYLFKAGWQMILVAFLSILVAVGAHYMAARISADLGYHLRQDIYSKILSFSNYEIDNFSTSSLITRSTNDIQQVSTLMTVILRFAIFAPVMAIFGIYRVIKTGSELSWIILLSVGLVILVVGGLLVITMPRFKILQKQVDQLNLIAREVLTGIQVIRSFGRQEFEAARFDDANKDLTKTQLFVNRAMSMMMPLMMLVMNGVSILIVWVAGHRIAEGGFQVGQMTAFMSYSMQIIFSFMIFSMLAVLLPRAIVSADRVEEVLQSQPKILDPVQADAYDQVQGLVSFDQVSFRYEGAKQDVLSQISFQAKPGQVTALIGSTGSGKSTILNLLLRFYDVSQGRILLDGHDLRDLKQEQIRDLIAYVPQKGVLFSGSVASNIKYADQAISDDAMILAAQIAHADDFVRAMEGHYQAKISQGGSNVSGGQKQRLSIARAIAKDAKILIFDDSFSALDYRTDAMVRKSLETITQDKTVIIVAQRVSTILHADNIIVLDAGQIVGQGDHHSLMETCEVYRQIAQSQLSAAELQAIKAEKVIKDGQSKKGSGYHG